jgi:hypothetical protein
MKKLLLAAVVIGVGGFVAGSVARGEAPESEGHRFGEWPAVNAIVDDGRQKNLNLDDQDFLIEVWFQPLDMLQYKGGAVNCLIAKKACDRLAGYDLSYGADGTLTLTLCDRKLELEGDATYSARGVLQSNAWNYVAVSYSHKAKRLVFYKNGRSVKECPDVELGDLSNRDPFSITWNEGRQNSQAHCRIREARVWRFRQGLPADLGGLLAAHELSPGRVAEELTGTADYSRWMFTASNDDIKDLGNNGNTLCYAPWGYKGAETIKPFPAQPQGKTYVVATQHPQATDEGAGTEDRPFKTIGKAAKAAGPGDLIRVGPGLYRERVMLRAGENGKPVTLEGTNGAIVSGADALTGWVKAENGWWVLKDWDGREKYSGPNFNFDDARSQPANLLYVDDEPMEFVPGKAELVPGTWTAEPPLHSGIKTLILCPLPGIDPAKVPTEISDVRTTLLTTKFDHVRRLHFTRGGVSVRSGSVLEDSIVDWVSGNGVGVGGQDAVVRNNKILWCGHTGMGGGGGLRNVIEGNYLAYNAWRDFQASWHAGATKFIPACTDWIIRSNEVCYSYAAGIYYDGGACGTVNEGNVCHDIIGEGLFDEIGYGNTWRDNVSYNVIGNALQIGNSSEDKVYRNILFNSLHTVLCFREGSVAFSGEKESPATNAALKAEFLPKLDVRRYQGMLTYERERTLREMCETYTMDYKFGSNLKNEVRENVLIGYGRLVDNCFEYGGANAVDPAIVNTYAGNYYYAYDTDQIINNGRYASRTFDLKGWQQISGQDKGSQFIDPWEKRDQMPAWFRERFHFRKDEFRPVPEVFEKYASKISHRIYVTVINGRLLRSKTIEWAKFTDPDLRGLYYEAEGQRCLSVWSAGMGMKYFMVPGVKQVVVENKFLRRKQVDTRDGRVALFVNQDPTTLMGIGSEIQEDRSISVELPRWTEPGRPITGKLLLENDASVAREYQVDLAVGPGWEISNGKVRQKLAAGEKASLDLRLVPPPEVRKGAFQLGINGVVDGWAMNQSSVIGFGSLQAMKHIDKLNMDGDLSDWGGDAPAGIADTKEQVVHGAAQWGGPADLSATVRLKWNGSRELFFAADVTDNTLITNHRTHSPTKSDSVQLLVDARAPWKQYMQDYTPGAFRVILVPGEGDAPATATFDGKTFGYIAKVASRKTDKGYTIEMDIHFRSGLVEEPGWAEKRELRVGVLVNDSDDPQGSDRKTTLGVWRTAADAAQDCTSLTTFALEK